MKEKYIFDTQYSNDEMNFIIKNKCEILSEIKLSKVNFDEHEIPKRMIRYGSTYIAETMDKETGELVWAILTKWKGVYHFSSYYESLTAVEEGL